jgi:hypothetical protein
MKSDKIVDLLLDGKLQKVKEAESLVDRILVKDGQEVETVTGTDVGDVEGKLASVPEEKKKREEEIAKEQTDLDPAQSPEKVENELDSGEVDQDIGKLKKEVETEVGGEESGALTEAEVGPADFKDYFDDLRKKGMTDEKKLSGMLNRAKEIAKKQGKENDKNTIVGIMQGFVGGK